MEEESTETCRIEGRAERSVSEPPDLENVLAGCRAREPESFEELFEHYKDYVYSVALYMSRDPELAADATQEVFLKLIDRIDQFQGRSRFATWLYRIVCNTVRDLGRRAPREAALDDLPAAVESIAPADSLDRVLRKDAAVVLSRAVARLSERLRLPLVLRYVSGLGYREIAEILEISPGTVASRLSRAHQQLARTVPRDRVKVS